MSFNFSRLTVKAQETVQSSLEIAQNYNNQMLEPEHILAALIQESGNIADTILQKAGGNVNRLKVVVNEMLEKLPKVSGTGIGSQQMSVNTAKLLDLAAQEAKSLKDRIRFNRALLLAASSSQGQAVIKR
jgi:ATP-dependent Clp protease ATP-binding subunit ClpB